MIKIMVSQQVREHLLSHFQNGTLGSKFTKGSLEEVLFDAMHLFADRFRDAKPDKDGRVRLSLCFPYHIGNSNVISLNQLTEEERETIVVENRGGIPVKAIHSTRQIPTAELQLILSADHHLITMFPGEMAPPLPASPDTHDDYWDYHVLIEPIGSSSL